MKRDRGRAEAKRLHDEVVERLVAQAVERLAQETLRRRFLQERREAVQHNFDVLNGQKWKVSK